MALQDDTTSEPLATEDVLELVLDILPSAAGLRIVVKSETTTLKKHQYDHLSQFQAAITIARGSLELIRKRGSVCSATRSINTIAHCLEKVVSPIIVPPELKQHNFVNLQAVRNIREVDTFFHFHLKRLGYHTFKGILQQLKISIDDLEVICSDIHQAKRFAVAKDPEEFIDLWDDVQRVHDAILACRCGDQLVEQASLQLSLQIQTAGVRGSCSLDLLVEPAGQNLFEELHVLSLQKELPCLNLMVKGSQLYHYASSSRSLSGVTPLDMIDLETILKSSSQSWRTQTKLTLATLLSYSLVYLRNGSWLHDGWRPSNIVFYKCNSIIPLRPYVRRKLALGRARRTSLTALTSFHHYPDLLEFGITLLEIFIGRRIEEYNIPSSDRWIVASAVLQMEQAKIPFAGYRDAVSTCLLQDFGVGLNCDPTRLRQQLFENVYRKIQTLLKQGFPELFATTSFDVLAAKIDLGSGELRASDSVDVLPKQTLPVRSRAPSATPKPLTTATEGFYLFADEKGGPEPSQQKCAKTDLWLRGFQDIMRLKAFPSNGRRVNVAILDTGIDMTHTDIDACSERIKDVRSWVDGKNGAEDWDGGDDSGHGTHIAGLILDLAPNVDIYVARVTKSRRLKNPEQVAEALKFAYSSSSWPIDIITMSFGFSKVIPSIRDQIDKAVRAERPKIVFAAASNDGKNSPRAFPANHSGVICIHSTKPSGAKSDFSPPAERNEDNFSILGEHIESSWPDKTQAGVTKRMTGTSFATPIALALTAFIMGYVWHNMPRLRSNIRLESYEGIRKTLRLIAAFNASDRVAEHYDYINPSRYFENDEKVQADIKYALQATHETGDGNG